MWNSEIAKEILGETEGKAPASSCLSPVALGMHTGGASHLYSNQAVRLWSESTAVSRLSLRSNCQTRPCRAPELFGQLEAKLGTLERVGLKPGYKSHTLPHGLPQHHGCSDTQWVNSKYQGWVISSSPFFPLLHSHYRSRVNPGELTTFTYLYFIHYPLQADILTSHEWGREAWVGRSQFPLLCVGNGLLL